MPLIVSCVEPSGRMIVPNVPLIIPVSFGGEPVTSTGGQTETHPPVHTIVLPVSLVLWYSVRPALFASTVPMPETESVWTESAVPDGEGEPPPDVLPLLRPHAARSRAASAIEGIPGRLRPWFSLITYTSCISMVTWEVYGRAWDAASFPPRLLRSPRTLVPGHERVLDRLGLRQHARRRGPTGIDRARTDRSGSRSDPPPGSPRWRHSSGPSDRSERSSASSRFSIAPIRRWAWRNGTPARTSSSAR